MSIKRMADFNLANQRVLIREDLNVPINSDGSITSDARIRAALPTIRLALEQRAAVMLMSHLGRPIEGIPAEEQPQFSLAPVAKHLGQLLGQDVLFKADWLSGVELEAGQICLFENVRFHQGEKENDPELAKQMAKLCDIFVMDAFGTAHRAQASTHGVAQYAKAACAGPLLSAELDALEKALHQPASPVVAIVGGSKVSTKLDVLESLAGMVDQLIVGGGIANTFLAAAGYDVGKSLYEADLIDKAKRLMEQTQIPLPKDVVVARDFAESARALLKPIHEVDGQEMILDIGPESANEIAELLRQAKTIIWNGPLGVFEFDQFGEGTKAIAQAVAQSDAFSLAGGGDTLAAIEKYQVTEKISYISTGGGAFLEFVEGKTLPAVAALQDAAGN